MSQDLKGLQIKNSNLIITHNDAIVNQVSILKIFCLFVVGECTISSQLIRQLQQHQISIYLVTKNLKPLCLIGDVLQGNYILRGYQYHHVDDQKLIMAKRLIRNKVNNQLQMFKMMRNKTDLIYSVMLKMEALLSQILDCNSQSSLRGFEGNAAKLFFQTYYDSLGWYRRAPRTREDVINTLLDIGYSYLYGIVESHLSLYGFDVYQGLYHTLFYERKSLVCDIIEPLRCIIDHIILKAWNLKQIQDSQFACIDHERVPKDRPARTKLSSIFLKEILEHKSDIFDYIKSYYRYVMSQGSTEFPIFIPSFMR